MNRQVEYIIHAGLSLILIMGVWKIIQSGPVIIKEQHSSFYCGTISPQDNKNLSVAALKGKALFMGKCASCHHLFKDGTGPRLTGFRERGPWMDKKNVYAWIRNPQTFMHKNKYTRSLKDQFGGGMMIAFPDITDQEIDAIIEYIDLSNR
jgi:cytochrome c2